MKKVNLYYGVTFGKCDSTEPIEWEIELTDEEAIAYDEAIRNSVPLEDVEELKNALERAYKEIEAVEIQNLIEAEYEYVMECQGVLPMDADEINRLIASRDEHALFFFGLDDADDEILNCWNAHDLSELPLVKDFVKDFEPYSPFDAGWELRVRFNDPNDDIYE